MFIGATKLTIWLDGNNELHYKSKIMRKIKDKVISKFQVSIAEVSEDMENPNYANLGIAFVGNDKIYIKKHLDQLIKFIEDMGEGRIESDQTTVISFSD